MSPAAAAALYSCSGGDYANFNPGFSNLARSQALCGWFLGNTTAIPGLNKAICQASGSFAYLAWPTLDDCTSNSTALTDFLDRTTTTQTTAAPPVTTDGTPAGITCRHFFTMSDRSSYNGKLMVFYRVMPGSRWPCSLLFVLTLCL